MATNYTTETKRNILLGILDKGTSRSATAAKAGIKPSTFYRKLNDNAGDFTLNELGRIAEVLDLKLADILPDESTPDAA